jgi:hypothetical protein
MALNSPLFKSLIDKINFKALQTINDNISYIGTDKVNHRNNDPIQEMFKILWKCYTIYYTLYPTDITSIGKLDVISNYATILNKLSEKKESLKVNDNNISEYEKNTKIKELHKLIDRFNYLRTECIDKGKEKVQICNLFKGRLYKYPFFNIHDTDIKEFDCSVATFENFNMIDELNFKEGILSFILNKKTNELLYIVIITYYNKVFVYDNRKLPVYNYHNNKVYKTLKSKPKIVYTPDNIPLLVLNKSWRLTLFRDIDKHNNNSVKIYNTVFNYLEWFDSIKDKCICYNLNIPNIMKYSGNYMDNVTNHIIQNTQKHIELTAPYDIKDNIDMLYYKTNNFINFLKDKVSKEFNVMKSSTDLDEGTLMIGIALNGISDITLQMRFHKNNELETPPSELVTDTLKLCFFKYLYHSLHTVYNTKSYKQYILTHYNKIVDLINKYPTVMGTNTKLTHIPEEMLNSKN